MVRTDLSFASPFALYGLSKLAVWWLRLGIRIERIEPGHPQQNGRHERFHRTLKAEATKPAAPNVLQTLLGWARMEEADRNFERAGELLDRAERLEPKNPSVMLARAILHGRTGAYSQALAILDATAAEGQGGLSEPCPIQSLA